MIISEEQKSEIYESFSPKLQKYFVSRIADAHVAEDLTSSVFLKVYEKLEVYDDEKAQLSTWIFTIARNTLIDYYRTRKVEAEIPEEYRDSADVDTEICNQETLEELAEALKKLPDRERELIIRHYYLKQSLKDIAGLMDYSYSYIKLLHGTALADLKKIMNF